jgi:hypothetical protein
VVLAALMEMRIHLTQWLGQWAQAALDSLMLELAVLAVVLVIKTQFLSPLVVLTLLLLVLEVRPTRGMLLRALAVLVLCVLFGL